MKILLARPIGNYLFPRSKTKTRIEELNYILEKDDEISADSIYLLNRIFDQEYLKKVKILLNNYKKYFYEYKFDFRDIKNSINEYNVVPQLPYTWSLEKKGFNIKQRSIIKYFTNLNPSRNKLLEIGFQKGYDYVCILDQDCFFDENNYTKLVSSIIKKGNYAFQSTRKLISNMKIERKYTEMFFALHKQSKIRFNCDLNYLENDKQEVLKKLNMYEIFDHEKEFFSNMYFEECKFLDGVQVYALESNDNFIKVDMFKENRIASLKYTCEMLRMRKI